MLLAIKYSVPSRGVLRSNQIWRIYKNVDKTYEQTEYVESISIESGIESFTGNGLYNIGFSLICEGQLECYIDPADGLRKARIYK